MSRRYLLACFKAQVCKFYPRESPYPESFYKVTMFISQNWVVDQKTAVDTFHINLCSKCKPPYPNGHWNIRITDVILGVETARSAFERKGVFHVSSFISFVPYPSTTTLPILTICEPKDACEVKL